MADAIFTIIRNARGPLSKSFALHEGRLQKTSAAEVTDGLAIRAAASDIFDLARIVESLNAHEALTFGIPRLGRARIATQKAINTGAAPKGAVARDRANFSWPKGRGVFMLDIDKPKDGAPLKSKDFDVMMAGLFPWWTSIARMYRPSASAFIHDDNGEFLTEHGSLRCYCFVDIAENIPFLGIALLDALWKAGMGRIEFSAAGSMLIRTAVDGAVWQPERLDFAGPVVLGAGLHRLHHKPAIKDGSDIDTEAVIAASGLGKITFSAWASNSLEVRIAKHAARPEEKARRAKFIDERVKAEVCGGADAKAARRKWRAALTDNVLRGNFVLHFRDKGPATVAEVLSNPRAFNLERLADPQEPDYAGDGRIAQFYSNEGRARPFVYSHAHGGLKYMLTHL